MALAIVVRGDRLLVRRRGEGTHLAGSWEFPGGKVRPGESPADAARRELLEETGLDAVRLEPLVVVVHDYQDRPLRLHCYLVPEARGETGDHLGWSWKTRLELGELEMPEANGPILRALEWRLSR